MGLGFKPPVRVKKQFYSNGSVSQNVTQLYIRSLGISEKPLVMLITLKHTQADTKKRHTHTHTGTDLPPGQTLFSLAPDPASVAAKESHHPFRPLPEEGKKTWSTLRQVT